MSHVERSRDMKMLQESDSMRSQECGWNKSQNNICGCKMSQNMDSGCKISQVVKLLTTLLSNFDCSSQNRSSEEKRNGENCDCRSQGRSFKVKRKRQRGGKGSRMRRDARRAEEQTARRAETETETGTETETAPPDPPQRTTSLIQDICGMTSEVQPKDEMIRTETETETETEIKNLQSKIDRELRSLSEINKEIDNRVSQLKLPPKLLPPKLPPKLIPKQDLHFVPMNPGKAIEKNLDHGQAYENTFDHSQTHKKKATVTTMIQPREKGTEMITKAKEFLEKASKEKDKIAEKKLERDRMCNTPGPGFEQNLFIPPHVTFCFICNQYKRQIHYCIETGSYINIDDKNIIILEGDSAAAVEGKSSQTKKVNRFKTRWEMRTYMSNEGFEIRKNRGDFKGYSTTKKFDELTKTYIRVYLSDIENCGEEKAIEMGRERKKEREAMEQKTLAMEKKKLARDKKKMAEFSQFF